MAALVKLLSPLERPIAAQNANCGFFSNPGNMGGRLALVERNGPVGKAKLYANAASGLGCREAFDATPPMLPGFEKKPQFAF